MPDFRLQPSFPIATVIDAAGRNAKLQEEAREAGNKSLIDGLQSIGQVGQSIYDTKKRVAQSLALGKQFDIPDEVSRTMDPSQILQVGAIKKGQVDMNMLLNMLHPGTGGTTPSVTSLPPTPHVGTPAPAAAPTAIQPGASAAINHDADLASISPTIPTPTAPSIPPAMPFGGASTAPTPSPVPVPIPAPPVKPQMVNPATISAAAKMGVFNKPESVFQYTPEKGLEKVGEKNKGDQVITSQPKANTSEPGSAAYEKNQQKLEQQYTQLKAKALSNRSGGLGLEDAKVDQAIHLRRLVNQYYDPKTGNFNIPKSQYGELTNGLATLLSPGGRPGIEIIHALQQKTAEGDLGGALAYLGITDSNGNVPVGSTQSVLKMMVDSIDRQGDQAEQNRTGYFDYIHGQAPSDLDPARIAKHDKQGLNSYNAFLAKAPDRVPTAGISLGGGDAARLAELRAKKAAGTLGK